MRSRIHEVYVVEIPTVTPAFFFNQTERRCGARLPLRHAQFPGLKIDAETQLRPPWRERGCPTKYTEAYRMPEWRKRIQDEKYRFAKLYGDLPAREREDIVQGETGTRPRRAKVNHPGPA